jgi:murein DD-endopeptidase MepM/ murein hydrolase activator NlpD
VTPPDIAPDRDRRRRLPIVIGSAVAAACLTAGVASAQTTEPADPPVTADPATDELQAEPESAEPQEAATDEAEAGDGATDPASAEEDAATQRKGSRLRLLKEEASPNKVFWVGVRKAKLEYKFAGARTADLKIEVWKKKKGDDKMIKRYNKRNVESEKTYTQRWNGRRSDGSHVRRANLYWVVDEVGGQRLNRKRANGDRDFRVYPAMFPVQGAHQYWDGFGAGRGHQGQDVGANCGTPLVAAEPGKVYFKGYDGGGYGYYVVVDVKGSNVYETYAHLKRNARVRSGSKVKTGERLGQVGETGNASGCHLHFEYRPNNSPSPKVTKMLKRWDGWS